MLCQEKLIQTAQEIRTSSSWILCCKRQDPADWFLKHHHLPPMTCRHFRYQKVTAYGGRGLLKHHQWINLNVATSCLHKYSDFPSSTNVGARCDVEFMRFDLVILLCHIVLLSNCFFSWSTFDSRPSLHYDTHTLDSSLIVLIHNILKYKLTKQWK